MSKKQITDYCRQFKTTGISQSLDQIIQEAEAKGSGFLDFTLNLLKTEADHRHSNEVRKRIKAAQLPRNSNLDHYNSTVEQAIINISQNTRPLFIS